MGKTILLSCYSCAPGRGSEPGAGWNVSVAMAEVDATAEIHVLTTFESKAAIEAEIGAGRVPANMRFHFYDFALGRLMWRHFCKTSAVRIHYQLWQRLARREVRRLHKIHNFSSAQHLTFVQYYSPSCLFGSGIPYIFGPVGGADVSPPQFLKRYPFKSRMFEHLRVFVTRTGERRPATKQTIREAALVIAATGAVKERCAAVRGGNANILLRSNITVSPEEIAALPKPPEQSGKILCFFGVGRLISWKGFEMAVRAFAQAAIPNSRLMFIGDGAERPHMEKLAAQLGISDKFAITGFLKRDAAFSKYAEGDVMLYPSHHDSSGTAIVEVMASGRPVVCLDCAGPAVLVPDSAGVKVPVGTYDETVAGLAEAIRKLAEPDARAAAGRAAAKYVRENYLCEQFARFYLDLHEKIEKGESL